MLRNSLLLRLQPNAMGGCDKVIGDVHGNATELAGVLKSLGPKDRLIIAGDLFDRGKDSVGVFTLLTSPNYKDKVFVVRGNHEVMAYNSIQHLTTLAISCYYEEESEEKRQELWSEEFTLKMNEIIDAEDEQKAFFNSMDRFFIPGNETDELFMAMIKDLRRHFIHNQGQWLLELFFKELNSGIFTVIKAPEPGKVFLSEKGPHKSLALDIRDYLANLPFIIHVQGVLPFLVAHASIPFSDKELSDFFASMEQKKGITFTADDIDKLIWARLAQIKALIATGKRSATSTVSIFGHNIIDDVENAVMEEINAIYVDVAACVRNTFLVVNMTTGTAEYSSPLSMPEPLLPLIQDKINRKLATLFKQVTVSATASAKEGKEEDLSARESYTLSHVEHKTTSDPASSSSSSSSPGAHYPALAVRCSPNPKGGQDHFVENVLGNEMELSKLLKSLGSRDTLVVMGNIFDGRKVESLKVLNLLNSSDYQKKVFVVRDVSDTLVLQMIRCLYDIATEFYPANEKEFMKQRKLWIERVPRKLQAIVNAKTPEEAFSQVIESRAPFDAKKATRRERAIFNLIVALRTNFANNPSAPWLIQQFVEELNRGYFEVTRGKPGEGGKKPALQFSCMNIYSQLQPLMWLLENSPAIVYTKGVAPKAEYSSAVAGSSSAARLERVNQHLEQEFKQFMAGMARTRPGDEGKGETKTMSASSSPRPGPGPEGLSGELPAGPRAGAAMRLSANPAGGHDKIFENVYGDATELKKSIESLGPNDSVFIMGNFFNEEKDSRGILNLLQTKGYKERVFAVCGKQELMALDLIQGLQRFATIQHFAAKSASEWSASVPRQLKQIMEAKDEEMAFAAVMGRPFDSKTAVKNDTSMLALIKSLRNHYAHGQGRWLFSVFLSEFQLGYFGFDSGLGSVICTNPEISGVGRVETYLRRLPFFIYNEGIPTEAKYDGSTVTSVQAAILSRINQHLKAELKHPGTVTTVSDKKTGDERETLKTAPGSGSAKEARDSVTNLAFGLGESKRSERALNRLKEKESTKGSDTGPPSFKG